MRSSRFAPFAPPMIRILQPIAAMLACTLLASTRLAHGQPVPDPVPQAAPQAEPRATPDPAAAEAAQAPATAGEAPAVVQEIDVVGERPGPGLWKVSSGDHVLWILGTLSPLPKKMTWRSTDVERVLDGSGTLLRGDPSVTAGIGPISAVRLYLKWRRLHSNAEHRTLKQVMPEPLYARFEALKAKYAPDDEQIETMAPIFAARRLYEQAIEASGLVRGDSIPDTVLKLAKKRKVAVRRIEVRIDEPAAVMDELSKIGPDAQIGCLEATIARLETDLQAMRERARAWATGDVEALRRLPYPNQEEACWQTVSASPRVKALTELARQRWSDAVAQELANNRTTLAMLPIQKLLAPDGVLAQFREKGYRIEEP